MSHLLKFGLGGVQESIAQSRKTRDLAAGSDIIARLSRSAMQATGPGVTLILPSKMSLPGPPSGTDSVAKWPHQVVLRVHADSELEVSDVGARMTRAVRDTWRDAITTAHRSLIGRWKREGRAFNAVATATQEALTAARAVVENQIEESIETYWVAVPESRNYRDSYRELTHRFDERRYSRTFRQLLPLDAAMPWTCSVCGVRSAIVQVPRWPEGSGFATRNERFCAICVARRWGLGDVPIPFPSTHRLARDRFLVLPQFEAVRAADRSANQRDVLDLLDDLDEWMLVPDRAAGRFGEVWVCLAEGGRLRALRSLSPYYAIVLLDGDQMGRWFSGELTDADLADTQTRLSTALRAFGEKLERIASDLRAHPIYVGGDDALLFAPLDALLPLIANAHESWTACVTRAFGDGHGPTMTLHASVIHAKEPLQAALDRTRELLHDAKDRGGRNCFSLYADARGGAAAHCIGSWSSDFGRLVAAVERFSNWRRDDRPRPAISVLNARKAEKLPGTLPHKWIRSTRSLFDASGSLDVSMQRALLLEIRRIADRSLAASDPVADWLFDRASKGRAAGRIGGEEAFREALLAIAFLARELEWHVS